MRLLLLFAVLTLPLLSGCYVPGVGFITPDKLEDKLDGHHH
jgi:hypothetical protein